MYILGGAMLPQQWICWLCTVPYLSWGLEYPGFAIMIWYLFLYFFLSPVTRNAMASTYRLGIYLPEQSLGRVTLLLIAHRDRMGPEWLLGRSVWRIRFMFSDWPFGLGFRLEKGWELCLCDYYMVLQCSAATSLKTEKYLALISLMPSK